MSSINAALLRRAFVDICRGYSVGHTTDGQTVYIRHLSHREHLDYDDLEATYRTHAAAQGALSEAQRVAELTAKGQWSADKEKAIERQRDFIVRLEGGRKTIAVPSIMRSHEEQIARERVNLTTMVSDRMRAIGMTTELYAARKLEDHYLVHNLFRDKGFTQTVFDLDSFDDLEDSAVEAIHVIYRDAIEPCSDANLRRLAVQDFFTSYYTLCGDNLNAFFGKPICELTYYQVRLGNVARYMKALMDNTDLSQLTSAQRGDPDVIGSKHITQKNVAAMSAEGKVPTGMNAADLKETGLGNQMTKLPPKEMSGLELVNWMMKNKGPGR